MTGGLPIGFNATVVEIGVTAGIENGDTMGGGSSDAKVTLSGVIAGSGGAGTLKTTNTVDTTGVGGPTKSWLIVASKCASAAADVLALTTKGCDPIRLPSG